jgi:hypothetical protein
VTAPGVQSVSSTASVEPSVTSTVGQPAADTDSTALLAMSADARNEWTRAAADPAADAVNAGRFAAVRGLYGEARQQWSSTDVMQDDKLAPVARQHLRGFAPDPMTVVTSVVVIVVNLVLILKFVGASA